LFFLRKGKQQKAQRIILKKKEKKGGGGKKTALLCQLHSCGKKKKEREKGAGTAPLWGIELREGGKTPELCQGKGGGGKRGGEGGGGGDWVQCTQCHRLIRKKGEKTKEKKGIRGPSVIWGKKKKKKEKGKKKKGKDADHYVYFRIL